MDTTKLEQAIEHVARALELLDKADFPSIYRTLETVKQMLWDEVNNAETLQAFFDKSDRQRGRSKQ
jgi:hypothetical protein